MQEIVISNKNKERHLALFDAGDLVEYIPFRPTEAISAGDIYYAVLEKVDQKLAAAFLNLGNGNKAFIHRKDVPQTFNWVQGAKLFVQVTREGTEIKLPLVTGNIEFANKQVVLMKGPHYLSVSKRIDGQQRTTLIKAVEPLLLQDEAVILRSAAEKASLGEITESLKELRQRYEALEQKAVLRKKPGLLEKANLDMEEVIDRWKLQYSDVKHIVTDDKQVIGYTDFEANLFEKYHLQAAIDQLLRPEVTLKNGSSLFIEKTEAMWIIDVNTHRYQSKQGKSEVVTKVNLAAIDEIIRQIRLRNMSGLIVIDFIGGMNEVGFKQVKAKMEVLTKVEYVTTQVADFSKTGLMQLTRRKKQKSLLENITITCPVCKGSGHVHSALSLAYQLERELANYKGLTYARIYITEPVLSAFLDLEVCEAVELEWEIGEEAIPYYAIRRIES